MEHFKSQLRSLYEKHLTLDLPSNSQTDDLAEKIDRIRELDGYIIGFVTAYLESNEIPQGLSFALLERLRGELTTTSTLSEEDKQAFNSTDHYLSSLETMGEILNKIKNE